MLSVFFTFVPPSNLGQTRDCCKSVGITEAAQQRNTATLARSILLTVRWPLRDLLNMFVLGLVLHR